MTTRTTAAALAVATIIGLAACGSTADKATDTTSGRNVIGDAIGVVPSLVERAAPTTKAPATTVPRTTQAPTTTAAPVQPTAADYSIALVTTEQQCFGSAGCNVTVVPELSAVGTAALRHNGTVQITYTITGDESGPVVKTITLTPDGKYEQESVRLSTTGADVVPTATITLVR